MPDKQKHDRFRHHKHTLQYTALGDSIAFGIGATGFYGYVNYFRDFLATEFHRVILTNQAVPGFTSTLLLLQLQQDSATRQAVKNANLITISIGGANLLNCIASPNPACFQNGVLTFAGRLAPNPENNS